MCFRLEKAVSSDKLVGSCLLLSSVLIFVYYTVWVIVLVGLFRHFRNIALTCTIVRPICALPYSRLSLPGGGVAAQVLLYAPR